MKEAARKRERRVGGEHRKESYYHKDTEHTEFWGNGIEIKSKNETLSVTFNFI
jgi:hypothetical protein